MLSTVFKSPESRSPTPRSPTPRSLLGVSRKKIVAGGVLLGLLATLQVPKLFRRGENEKVREGNELSLELDQSDLPARSKFVPVSQAKTTDRTEVHNQVAQDSNHTDLRSTVVTPGRLKDYIEIIVREKDGGLSQGILLGLYASTGPGLWSSWCQSRDQDGIFRLSRPSTADPNEKVHYSIDAPFYKKANTSGFFRWRDEQVVIQLVPESCLRLKVSEATNAHMEVEEFHVIAWPAVSTLGEHRVDPAYKVVRTKDGAMVGLDQNQDYYIQVIPHHHFLPSTPIYIKRGQTSHNLQLSPLQLMAVCCTDSVGNPIRSAKVYALFSNREPTNLNPNKLAYLDYPSWVGTEQLDKDSLLKLSEGRTNSKGKTYLQLPDPSLPAAKHVTLWVSINNRLHRFPLTSLFLNDWTLTVVVN